jgi:hypothetical protein
VRLGEGDQSSSGSRKLRILERVGWVLS